MEVSTVVQGKNNVVAELGIRMELRQIEENEVHDRHL